ncbi:hypothetical protein KJ567_02495 [Candidatus Bipolaricaulota bacterium]|nr:hypothetical protein [Candidatus Bipolaricaulota bacterium]
MTIPRSVSCRLLAALAIALSVAASAAAQGTPFVFGGLFEATILSTQTTPVTLKSLSLSTVLGIGEYSVQMDARFTNSLFDTLTFNAAGPFGDVPLSSSLAFNPSTLSFLSWQTSAALQLLDIAFSNILYITKPQSASYDQLTAAATMGDIVFQGVFKVGVCPLCFWETSFCGNWTWFECDTALSLCIQFTDAGFEGVTAGMSGLMLFEDVFGIQATLNVSIVYGIDEKTLTPTLQFKPDWFICPTLEILGEVAAGPATASFASLSIYGLQGECAMNNGVTFTFADSFDPAKNSAVTGKADYFERFGVSGPLSSCCGAPGAFNFDIYFQAPPRRGHSFAQRFWRRHSTSS